MKTLFLAVAFVLALSGCAGNRLKQWSSEHKPLAEQGKMLWSDYYTQLYAKALESNIANKGSVLERINIMIYVSKEHESGRMTKDYFDYMTRLAQAAQAADDERSSMQSKRAMASALQGVSNAYGASAQAYRQQSMQPQLPAYTPPTQIRCNTLGNQTNCTSN